MPHHPKNLTVQELTTRSTSVDVKTWKISTDPDYEAKKNRVLMTTQLVSQSLALRSRTVLARGDMTPAQPKPS